MLGTLLTLACVLVTCARAQTHDGRTIFRYMEDEGFYQMAELMSAAGMRAELDNQNANPVTIFAPDDDAFSHLPQDIQLQLLTNATFMGHVLKGHIVQEQILRVFIRDQQQKLDMNGNRIIFNVYSNGVTTVNGAVLTGSEVLLSNGLVHHVQEVMMPFSDTISTFLAEHDTDFRDLFAFVVLARMIDDLSDAGPYTLLAPNDAAFDRVKSNITAMLQNPDRTPITELVKNHLIQGQYWSVGLVEGMTLTSLHGTHHDIKMLGPIVTFSGLAHVINPDQGTTNGVVHTIDTVLFP